MKLMIVPSKWNDRFLKCKRCKNEFKVIFNSFYSHTVCFCPSCGQPARPKGNKEEKEDEDV